jgi:Tfp pilus assembly protein PilF
MRRHAYQAAIVGVAALLGAVGCGGAATPTPQAPEGTHVQTPPTGGPGVATTQGKQYAITDQPSSGASAANRPKMNAAAAQAYTAGLASFKNGDLEGARTQFSKATQADANAYQAFYSLGVVQERLGDDQGALTSYRAAVNIVKDYEPAIVAYGLLLARMDRASEADSYLTGEQAQMPKSAAVVAALAEVKSIEGDSADAQQLAQQALKINPDYRPAMVTLARDHYRHRRLDLALYTLKGILDGYGPENPPRDKNNAQALMLRGLIYGEEGRRADAIKEFKQAVALRPDLVQARVQLATYLLESGNAEECASLLQGALRYDKDNVLAHLNLGDAERLLGQTSEAIKELEWVVNKDPTIAQAHYDLGLLYLFSNQVPGVTPEDACDKAISEFDEYKKMQPRAQGAPDDTEELITRAKTKKAILVEQAKEKAQAAQQPAPTSGSGSTGSMPSAGAPAKAAPAKAAPAKGAAGSMPALKGGAK